MGEETAAKPAGTVAAGDVGGEAVTLLQELIRIDTVNPPGNEEHALVDSLLQSTPLSS